MKKLLIIFLVCGSAKAATYNVTSYHTPSDLGIVSGDIVNIQNNGWLEINSSFACSQLSIVTGGKVSVGVHGTKMSIDGITMSGGEWSMGAGDTIEVKNLNLYGTHDINISGGLILWSGTVQRPVVVRTNPTVGNASVIFTGASWTLNLDYVKFVNMSDPSGSTASGGVNFVNRTIPSFQTATNLTFDTATVAMSGCNGMRLSSGSIYAIAGQDAAATISSGVSDSITDYTITHESGHGIYTSASNFPYLYNDSITQISNAGAGYGITLTGGLTGSRSAGAKITNCVVTNFATNLNYGGTAPHDNSTVFNSRFIAGQATHINVGIQGNGNTIAGSQIYGSTTRGGLVSYDGTSITGLKLYYNDFGIGIASGPPKAPICFDCTAGTGCNYVVNGVEMVGNIVYGKNSGFHNADIWVSGGVRVNVTKFENNALDIIDTTLTAAHFSVPLGAWPGTNKVTSSFGFLDSLAGDFRLASGSIAINAGDSTYFAQVFGSINPPGDIGYYQTYSTGTGTTPPTGACCQTDGTCASITQAQCAQQGGAYHGDGSLCADYDCTQGGGGPGPGPGTGPAPLAKQLRIGWLTYRAPWWSTANDGNYSTTLRDWAANRANLYVGANTKTDLDYIKTVNPSAKGLTYAIFGRYYKDTVFGITQDTGSLRSWGDSMLTVTGDSNYLLDSMVLKATGAGFTVNPDGQGARTTTSGQVGQFLYYGPYSIRYMFDLRNYRVGQYLYKRFKDQMTSAGTDGIMMDEEGLIGVTGRQNAGNGPPMPPFKSASQWTSGFNNFNRTWGTSDFTVIGDSLSQLRNNGWGRVLGDSMTANTKLLMPNGAAYWGPHASNPNNWTNEALGAIDAYRGALLGENYAFAAMAGNAGGALGANRHLIGRLHGIRDSGLEVSIWFECGPYDSSLSISQRRYKMGALGLMLMGTFPGSTKYYWVPNPGYNYTNFRMPQSGAPQNLAVDTTWLWSYAWGKYFGVAMTTRDSSQTGTDPASQAYTIWKVALTHPTNGTSDTLTFACGRWYQGANIDTTTTGVNVTLPGSAAKKWYLLKDNSGASGIGGLASWSTTVYTGGSSVKVGNAHWLVFSSDTALANNGISDTTLVNVGDSKVEGQTIDFTVSLNKTLQVTDSFFVTLTSGTATKDVDFTDVGGWYTISPGSLSATVSVPTTDDILVEGNQTFTMTISLAKYGRIATATATGTILDNDFSGQPGTSFHFRHWGRH